MTSTTVNQTRPATRLTFSRVLRAELTKSVSTRSSKALMSLMIVGTVLSAVLVFIYITKVFEEPQQWVSAVDFTSIVPGLLLPAFLILLSTSEWSSRSVLTTFTLCPRRSWVVAAKSLVAALYMLLCWTLVTLAGFVVAKAGAAAGTSNVLWNVEPSKLANILGQDLIIFASAYAIGLALMNGPAAITFFYAAPTALGLLQVVSPAVASALKWVNLNSALADTFQAEGTVTSTAWAHLATSIAVWIVLPGIIGTWRMLHREAS